MNSKQEWKILAYLVGVFVLCFYLPIGWERFDASVLEALHLVKWYAREHVLLCLVPAFFIAGAIGVFVSQGAVMKYLGANAPKALAYGVASVSGSILAVCSCTILPLFSGIYRMGAGLGPACAFLYAGPAINVLAIILTARILGLQMGIARAVGAIVFSIVIGLCMHFLFRKEEQEKAAAAVMPDPETSRPLWQNALFFASMVGILVFANWGKPSEGANGVWMAIWSAKWIVTSVFAAAFAAILATWFDVGWKKVSAVAIPVGVLAVVTTMADQMSYGQTIREYAVDPHMIPFVAGVVGLSIILNLRGGEAGHWFDQTWTFAKQILPLLFWGVLVAGFLLGRPYAGTQGMIPPEWVEWAVGGNSLRANAFASVAGAFMYFATLTEVPILQGLMESGMGRGPALALLLAGPALSLPNMLVIRSVMGTKKTLAFVSLVVIMATISGILFGAIVGE